MTRYFTFLRAINVGGHTVKMDQLRQIFETLEFSNVETFIASGNVIFEAKTGDSKSLEKNIEITLKETLGYEVVTFIRTQAEFAAIAKYKPFPQSKLNSAAALNIGFLADKPDALTKKKIMAMQTKIDEFHIHERELYWLCKKKQSESKISNVVIEKTLGLKTTLRGINTINKMAEKHLAK